MASIGAGIANVVCAIVLLAAGAMKLGHLSVFGQQITAYQIIPERLARVAGYVLPPIEVLLGISMLFAPQLAAAAVFLFASFALAVGFNVLRGRTDLRCACFGVTGQYTISWAHVAGNAILALLATITFVDITARHSLPFRSAFQCCLLLRWAPPGERWRRRYSLEGTRNRDRVDHLEPGSLGS